MSEGKVLHEIPYSSPEARSRAMAAIALGENTAATRGTQVVGERAPIEEFLFAVGQRLAAAERALEAAHRSIPEEASPRRKGETDERSVAQRLEAVMREVEALRDDKARLDFLDEMNSRLNASYGTTYRWRLILNHNVNRLMLDKLAVDLHDSEPRSRGLTSCRDAIDAEIRRVESGRRAR